MALKTVAPFANFVDVLKNMDTSKMQAIIKNHQEFHRLCTWCEAKKWIEILPKMTGIRVVQYTPEVYQLKAIIDELKPGGFKWLDDKRDNTAK